MARNSKGQTVQTLSLVTKITVLGDPSNWDWESIIAGGAMLDPDESVEVLSVNVEES